MPKDTKKTGKTALLEVAREGRTIEVSDPKILKTVAEFAQFRSLRAEAEKMEKGLRETIEQYLIENNAAVLVTAGGTVTLTEKERSGLNKDLIPAEILAAAETVTHYVELKVAGARLED